MPGRGGGADRSGGVFSAGVDRFRPIVAAINGHAVAGDACGGSAGTWAVTRRILIEPTRALTSSAGPDVERGP